MPTSTSASHTASAAPARTEALWSSPGAQSFALNLKYLLRLRWGALLGQLALIIASQLWWGIRMPAALISGVLAVGLVSNFVLQRWQATSAPEVRPRMLVGVMLFDTLLLTVVLYLSGGPFNPFSTLYLVNVALAAVLLPSRTAWALCAAALACFAALFPLEQWTPPAGLTLPNHAEMMRLHLHGMWLAFALSAGLILLFVLRVKGELSRREEELVAAKDLARRRDKLASLATLAGGAAHELATPLTTISLVLEDLDAALRPLSLPNDVRSDVALAQSQVSRCRTILRQMAAESGELAGEAPMRVTVRECLDLVRSGLDAGGDRLDIDAGDWCSAALRAPPQALATTIRGLVKNALQASTDRVSLSVQATSRAHAVAFEIRDRGPGMSADTLARAGEPFFTTKQQGEGMGLGLFLARALADRLGGELTLSSVPGTGTVARFELPLSPEADDTRAEESAS